MGYETQKVEFMPLGGVNVSDNLSRLDPMEVSNSDNLLYERRRAITRPGLSTIPLTGVVGPVVFVENVVVNASQYNVFIGASGRLFYFPGVEITGPGTTFGALQYNNATSIIGLLVLGNNTGGIITSNPNAGNVYTVQATAPYRYVSGHQGRAVAAYKLGGGSALLDPRTFAWSKPGDLTVWTSVDGSAGSLAIAECNDEITGLGVLHNIVVILRRYGIHLAYPTGTLPLPYNVQSFSLKGKGCFYPSTTAWSDEIAYYVGEDDVYTFDLQSTIPIGGKIREELLTALRSGINYRGFFTHTNTSFLVRRRYNLIPLGSASSHHYVYDIVEQTWSKHSYTNASNWGWDFAPLSGATDWGTAFVDNSSTPNMRYWDDQVAIERPASFTRYMGKVDQPDRDFAVQDALIRLRDWGSNNLTVQVTGTGSSGVVTTTSTRTVGSANNGKWIRQFMSRGTQNLRQVGNEFVVTVTSPAGAKLEMDYIALLMTDSGEFRG